MKCMIFSVALYAAGTWTLMKADVRPLEAFEMCICRRMERISWVDKISNKEMLAKVEKDRQIMKIIQQRQHYWIGHILRHESLLLDIIEGRMEDRPTRGRRRLQMLHMLANDGYVAVKREAEEGRDGVKESHVRNLLHSRILHCVSKKFPPLYSR